MNDYIRRNLESGQRCRQWFIDFASLIPGGSIFATKSAAMTAKVDQLETTAGEQEAASSAGMSATDVKGSERDDLEAALTPVRTAARAAEFDVPGTRERYRFNVSMTDQELLAAGRSFALGGATDEALLKDYGAAAGWPAAVTTAGYLIDNVFANDIAALTSWKSAAHVEKPPSTPKPPAPPTP